MIHPLLASRSHGKEEWKTLRGINLKDEKVYRIAMLPDGRRDTVVPESFRIILRQYLQHPEAKSLAPDGNACIGSTQGLLRRETIVAHKIASIGKETDRSWDQGGDPSILDFKSKEFGNESKLVIANPADSKRWRKLGVRHLMRKSGLSQKTVYAILDGEQVRRTTLVNFMRAVDGLAESLALVRHDLRAAARAEYRWQGHLTTPIGGDLCGGHFPKCRLLIPIRNFSHRTTYTRAVHWDRLRSYEHAGRRVDQET